MKPSNKLTFRFRKIFKTIWVCDQIEMLDLTRYFKKIITQIGRILSFIFYCLSYDVGIKIILNINVLQSLNFIIIVYLEFGILLIILIIL